MTADAVLVATTAPVGAKTFSKAGFKTKQQISDAARHNLFGFVCENLNGATSYLQFFNAAATGDVTLGTTAPTFQWPVPANGFADESYDMPIQDFPLGLVVALTTAAFDGLGAGGTLVTTGGLASFIVK